jgi:hypothetical protein
MYRHPNIPAQHPPPPYPHYGGYASSQMHHPQMHPSQMHHPHSLMYGHHPGQGMMSMMSPSMQQQQQQHQQQSHHLPHHHHPHHLQQQFHHPQQQQSSSALLKKAKKLKDPNAPKKASTAFMLWSLASRPRIREQFPELGFADIGKKLGEEWALLDEKSKDHWQRQAEKDRERYEREQSAYLKSSALSGKRRRRKDPNAPKQPLTAYVIFSNEVRDQVINENPDANFGEIGKIIGAKWRALVPDDRKPYEEKANIERERYNRDLEDYRRSQGIYEPLQQHHHLLQQQQQQHHLQPHPLQQQSQQPLSGAAAHHPMYPMDDLFDDDDEGLGDESIE